MSRLWLNNWLVYQILKVMLKSSVSHPIVGWLYSTHKCQTKFNLTSELVYDLKNDKFNGEYRLLFGHTVWRLFWGSLFVDQNLQKLHFIVEIFGDCIEPPHVWALLFSEKSSLFRRKILSHSLLWFECIMKFTVNPFPLYDNMKGFAKQLLR